MAIVNLHKELDKKKLEALVEIYEKINPFFTTKVAGTGLGLAAALATIKAYNGDIKVQNDQAFKLTTFVIKIPIPDRKG